MMLEFHFSVDFVKSLGELLERAPYRKAAPILAELSKQANNQPKAPVVETPKVE